MSEVEFDTSDVDRWIGVPLGGGQLKEPVHVNDIRRWAQGMQNPNPLYYDEEYAAGSRFEGIVGPQSFTIQRDVGHGATPAIQGHIDGTHMLFGGDEWWFHGPRIFPGDQLRSERMLFDYRVTETKFAGPTMFSRGDTTYINQRGEVVAKQRSTAIRYRADLARKKAAFADSVEPEWTEEDLERIQEEKFAYYDTFRSLAHGKRLWKDVKEGEELPRRPIGPHSIQTFTTEWRAYDMTIWGAARQVAGHTSVDDAGWLPEMSRDLEKAKIDPVLSDGLYHGASRGHVQEKYAKLIGMPRGYGYGASMGAWVLDWLGNWAGEHGFIVHSNAQYRFPALTGDLTYLDGRVVNTDVDTDTGQHLVHVEYEMTTQDGAAMAHGSAEIALPTE